MNEQADFGGRPSAGALIRQAREAAGLHISAMSVALKVPVKKLEALEADRVDLLPDAVFARALAASVCRTLKIDAGPVLDALPQLALPTLGAQGRSINASFRPSAPGVKKPVWEQLSKPWVMAVLALAAATLVLMLLPSIQQSALGLGNSPGAVLPPAAVASQALPALPAKISTEAGAIRVEDVATQLALPAPAAVLVPNPELRTDAKPVPDVPPVNASPATSGQALAAQAAAAPAAVQDGILMIKTRGPSWVEVTDAIGNVQLRKTMVEGENLGVSGRLPMRVVLGRADMAEVQVRGQPLNLTPSSKDNVARFEVR